MDDQNKNNQAAKDQAALILFIDELIQERKDPAVNEQNLNQVRAVLLKRLNDDVNRHLINLLTEKKQLELDEYLDKNPSDAEVMKFFADNIPNIEAEMASVLVGFKTAYLYRPERDALQNVATQKTSVPQNEDVDLPMAPPKMMN